MTAYTRQLLFANNAQSSLAGSITNSSTAANLASGTGVFFPAPGTGQSFVGTFTDAATGLLNEIVQVTNVTGDTITIIRAQEGTTALAWAANDLFDELWTAGQAETMVQQSQAQSQSFNYAVDTGSANAYVVGLLPTITAPVAGMPIRVLIANSNTGPSTFNPGSGAASVRRRDGTALIGGELLGGDIVEFKWDGTYFRIPGIAPATDAAVAAGTDTQTGVTPAQLASVVSSLPTGAMVPFAGLTAPASWLLTYGQAVSRTTYAALLAAITTSAVVTITIATPGVVTWTGHTLVNGDKVSFETTGALPTGLSVGTDYYVVNAASNTFQVSATVGGGAIATSGSQTGTQTCRYNPYGCGNGTTTFNVPDMRGRVAAGADAMGGSAASRLGNLTTTTGGISGPAVQGASGGQQSHVQVVAEIAAHVHASIYGAGSVPNSGGAVSGALPGDTSSTGSGTAANVTQPTLVSNFIIKT